MEVRREKEKIGVKVAIENTKLNRSTEEAVMGRSAKKATCDSTNTGRRGKALTTCMEVCSTAFTVLCILLSVHVLCDSILVLQIDIKKNFH